MDAERVERVWAEVEAWGPEVLVFDVGQVLVRWDPERPYLDLIPDAAAREGFWRRTGLDSMNLEGDRGRLDRAVEAWAARHPDDADLIRAWRARWGEMFGPAIPESAALMLRAKAAGLRVAALSNFAADTWEVARAGFPVLREFDVEVIGTEATYGANSRVGDSREVTLKIGMAHDDERALRKVLRDPPSFGLAVPGSSAGGAVPRPTPRMLLRSYLVPRELLPATVEIDGEHVEVDELPVAMATGPGPRPQLQPVEADAPSGPTVTLPLIAIAHGRSGDKGIDANIGIRARHPDFLPVIRHSVTAERVAEHLAHLLNGGVDRYDLPGLDAINLHLHDALGGGGIASLRLDPQGKAFAQQLLDLPIEVPTSWLDHDAIADIPEVEAARS